MPRHSPVFAALVAVLVLACEAVSPPPRLVPVHLHLTDAPSDQIASATVRIASAYLVPAGEDGEFHTIFDEMQEHDLLTLQNGVTALLGSADIPEGEYAQLRLVVDQAEITLIEGASFADGSRSKTLFVPSGTETGIKVQFSGPLTINGETDLLADIDVERNFVFLGPPGAPEDVLFTPLVTGRLIDD